MEPQMKGVVIISLPPPDDPSNGKTITAFAFPDSEEELPPEHQHQGQQGVLPAQSPPPSPSNHPFSFKRAAIGFLGASLLLVALWACLFSEAPLQFLESSEEAKREASSLLLPIYRKHGGQRFLVEQAEVKLGFSGNGSGVVTKRVGRSSMMASSSSSSSFSSSSAVNSSSAVFPVRGNIFPDGLYYTSVFIGNPPRHYYLDIDTGSDLTWIQCDAPCTSCAKGPNPLYKPTRSKLVPSRDSLCLQVQNSLNSGYCESCPQCDYEIEYADHSSSIGVLARDELQLKMVNNELVKSTFVFGCAYDQQGQLLVSPAKTDGILGLSSSKISLPSQLSIQNIIANVVGHCIKAEGGGYMFLGDDFVPRWGMTWVPMVSILTKFYQTEVLKISYGDRQLAVRGNRSNVGNVVFDTGSSYTYFTNEAYTDLIASIKDIPGLVQDYSDQTLPMCWRANFPVRSVKDVKHFFGPLTLHFGKRWLVMTRAFLIPPEGYLIVSNKGNVCLGILNGTEVHDGSTNILGDISLRGQLVVYDIVKQQVGWIRSDCSKPQRAMGFPFLF